MTLSPDTVFPDAVSFELRCVDAKNSPLDHVGVVYRLTIGMGQYFNGCVIGLGVHNLYTPPPG